MRANKDVVKKQAITDLAVRMEHLERIVLQLRGEQMLLDRISAALPTESGGQRTPLSKLIASSANKVHELSRDINNHVVDGRRSIAALKAVL